MPRSTAGAADTRNSPSFPAPGVELGVRIKAGWTAEKGDSMAYTDAVESELKGLEAVSPGGMLADCPTCGPSMECQGDCGSDDPAVCYCYDEGGFSWSSCDGCGSTLGGNRQPGHGFDPETKSIVHLDLCVDCVCYLANGDLPEHWDAG